MFFLLVCTATSYAGQTNHCFVPTPEGVEGDGEKTPENRSTPIVDEMTQDNDSQQETDTDAQQEGSNQDDNTPTRQRLNLDDTETDNQSEEQDQNQSANNRRNNNKKEDEDEGNALSRMKTRISFTKTELGKISDPRIRDLYWYALNDTTDKKRYLRVHYAFNKLEDNWSYELRGGAQTVYMNSVEDRFDLGPQIEFGLKKDVHPYWAARVEVGWSHFSHELYTAHLSTMCHRMDLYPYTTEGADWWMPIEYSTLGLRGGLMLNIMNMIGGRELIYSPYAVYAYAGAGFAYSFAKFGQKDGSCIVPQWFFGAQGAWNFTQRFSLTLDANVSWQGDDLEGFTTQNSTWKYAALLGISYKFSKIIHFQRLGYDETFNSRPILDAEYNDDGDYLQTMIEQKEKTNTISGDMIQAAFFQIDRIELQHTYVLNLGFYAQVIKSHPDQKFLVKGFADIEVGSMKRNLWLSEQRAKVVAEVLVKTYGVNADQLVVGGGDLDYDIPFLRQHGHHRFNRCTIVCPIEEDYQIIKESTFEDPSELMDGRVPPPAKNY